MLKVYGYSDDLVEIEGAEYPNDEIDCFEHDVRVKFKDGTSIRIGYNKPNLAVWWIQVENRGTATQSLTECFDPDATPYSDVFTIDSEIQSVRKISRKKR